MLRCSSRITGCSVLALAHVQLPSAIVGVAVAATSQQLIAPESHQLAHAAFATGVPVRLRTTRSAVMRVMRSTVSEATQVPAWESPRPHDSGHFCGAPVAAKAENR